MVVEEDSGLAAELWNGPHPVSASVLAYPEGRAALAAARRGGRLTARAHHEALSAFEDSHAEAISLGVDAELAQRAGALAEEQALRGDDAVHLATALELGDDEAVMVTWDEDLGRAATDAGLSVAGAT